jgi:hypothetical protein
VGLCSLSALVLISNSQIYSPENVSQNIGVGDQELHSMPAYWPTKGWHNVTPEEQGIDSAKLAEGLLAIRQKDIPITVC